MGLILINVANVLFTIRDAPYLLHTMEIHYKSTTLTNELVIDSNKTTILVFLDSIVAIFPFVVT